MKLIRTIFSQIRKMYLRTGAYFMTSLLIFAVALMLVDNINNGVIDTGMLLSLLLFSFMLAVSDLILAVKFIPSLAKRALQFMLYAASFFISFTVVKKIVSGSGALYLLMIFAVIYLIAVGIGALYRRLTSDREKDYKSQFGEKNAK